MSKKITETKEQPQQQQIPFDFMPHWKDEQKCFDDAGFITDANTGKKTDQTWTRVKPMTQLNYERWLEKVVDQDTKQWNPKRDKDGNVINETARYVVSVINRVKVDKNEYLLSKGFLRGYDAGGTEVVNWCSYPERWTRTSFNYERFYDSKRNKFDYRLLGPGDTELVYSLPFSKEAVDKLVEGADPEQLELNVLDARTNDVTRVYWSNGKESLRLFKEKPFDELALASYIPEPVRAELRVKAEQRDWINKTYSQEGISKNTRYLA
jgi:hypothetical protein